MHDLAGIEQAVRIEARLHFFERAHELRAEHEFVKFRAHDAVAVLAGMRALVGAHHRERVLGDRAHRLHVLVEPQVEHRTHMQAAGARMRIPGAARAVLLEHLGETRGVFREMLERHRAILDEGDRLPLLLHRHHDVEARGAHLGDRGLQCRIEHLDHAALLRAGVAPGIAEIAHQLAELLQAAQIFVVIVLAEFDQQDRIRIAAHELLERRTEHRDLAAPARSWCGRSVRRRSASAARYAGRHPSHHRSGRNGTHRPRAGRAAAPASARPAW